MKRYIKIKVSNLLGGSSNLDKILKLNNFTLINNTGSLTTFIKSSKKL